VAVVVSLREAHSASDGGFEAHGRCGQAILTVQEVSVAAYRRRAKAKDVYGDIHGLARIYGVTKDVALAAAHREAELKDIAENELRKRDPKKT